MPTITAATPTTIPSATYGVWWIKNINIDNTNVAKPMATIAFYLGDNSGAAAPGVANVFYRVDIMAKIGAGDTDLATLFGTLVAKAGALAIADGKITGTVG